MRPPKKNVKDARTTQVVEFPPEVCAVCSYCHLEKDNYLCYVNEPQISGYDDETPIFSRGIPVDPNWPMCMNFKPRMHT